MAYMPQLAFETYGSQIFWCLLFFGVLYSKVEFYFVPKLKNMIAEREMRFSFLTVDALNIFDFCESQVKAQRKVIDDARVEASAIISKAQGKLELQRTYVRELVSHMASSIVSDSGDLIAQEVGDMEESFRCFCYSLVELYCEKLIGSVCCDRKVIEARVSSLFNTEDSN